MQISYVLTARYDSNGQWPSASGGVTVTHKSVTYKSGFDPLPVGSLSPNLRCIKKNYLT